jgi:hypothetical protein
VKFHLEPSAAEFAADLRAAAKALEGNMKEASEVAARRGIAAMRQRYSAKYSRGSGRGVGTFRSTGDTLAFGSSSVPYPLGQNFGSSGRYRQFPRQANPDHFAFSALRAETKSIAGVYGKAADSAMRKAFN